MNGISDFQERRSFIFRSPFCRSPHEQWHHGGTSFELLLWTHNHSLGISTRREEVLDTFSAAPAVLGQQFLSPWHNEPPRGRCLGLSLYSRVFYRDTDLHDRGEGQRGDFSGRQGRFHLTGV